MGGEKNLVGTGKGTFCSLQIRSVGGYLLLTSTQPAKEFFFRDDTNGNPSRRKLKAFKRMIFKPNNEIRILPEGFTPTPLDVICGRDQDSFYHGKKS